MLVDSTSLSTFSFLSKMESLKCKFCSQSFFNGRSLTLHMRSHMPNEEEERPSQLNDETDSDFCSSPENSTTDDQKLAFSGHEDGGSEIFKNLTRKRSRRTRKLESFVTKKMKTSQLDDNPEAEPGPTEPPHSSASDTTTEEDLAFCLMMLSRDKWKKNKKNSKTNKQVQEEVIKNKGRYRCETCGKIFKSYQALGGHRASHKKNKTTEYDNNNVVAVVTTTPEKRIHECPICKRVFASGQALGGHKRSHGIGNLSVNHKMIDLNLPAPTEEDNVLCGMFQ